MRYPGRILATLGGATLALALTACADDEVEEPEESVVQTESETVAVVDFDPLSRDYTLTPEQQAARDAFDAEAMQTEYASYRDSMGSNQTAQSSQTDTSTGGAAAANSGSGTATGGGMPERSQMDWNYLDRNSDGQLSVAEYAIWAVPVDPNAPKRNDETKPYLNSDQANKAADSFFFFDRDGNTYLSQEEFNAARRGEGLN